MTKIQLKNYQQQILDELEYLPSVALFMGTGSGKTYTSLFRVKENPTKNLLVVCPARVVEQWQESIPKALPTYKIFEYPKSASAKVKDKMLLELEDDYNVVVVSLEVVAKLDSLLRIVDKSWTIIVDESHKIKEYGTARSPVKVTHRMLRLGDLTDYKILLTATPTQKEFGGYIDYYTQLRFLGFMNITKQQFEDRYCNIKKMVVPGTPYPIKKIVGYKNTKELDSLLGLVARRYVPKFTEDDPVMIEVRLPVTRSYIQLLKDKYYEDLDLSNISAMRMAKKTLTSGVVLGSDNFRERRTYVDNTIKRDWVEDFLSNTDEVVIIFYKYNVEREQLEDVCKNLKLKYIVINGANNHKKESIESEGYRVVLGQYNACGESIDGLQYRSHIVIYYAMPESSLEYVQSLGRIDRIGQEYVPTYYHLVMDKTIDAEIYKMTLNKVEFNTEVLDKLNI